MAYAGNDVGCVAAEAGAGAMVGGGAVVAEERPDVGSSRAIVPFKEVPLSSLNVL